MSSMETPWKPRCANNEAAAVKISSRRLLPRARTAP
jgi:hypothetical protein